MTRASTRRQRRRRSQAGESMVSVLVAAAGLALLALVAAYILRSQSKQRSILNATRSADDVEEGIRELVWNRLVNWANPSSGSPCNPATFPLASGATIPFGSFGQLRQTAAIVGRAGSPDQAAAMARCGSGNNGAVPAANAAFNVYLCYQLEATGSPPLTSFFGNMGTGAMQNRGFVEMWIGLREVNGLDSPSRTCNEFKGTAGGYEGTSIIGVMVYSIYWSRLLHGKDWTDKRRDKIAYGDKPW